LGRFHQIYDFGAFEDKDELIRFRDQKVKYGQKLGEGVRVDGTPNTGIPFFSILTNERNSF